MEWVRVVKEESKGKERAGDYWFWECIRVLRNAARMHRDGIHVEAYLQFYSGIRCSQPSSSRSPDADQIQITQILKDVIF